MTASTSGARVRWRFAVAATSLAALAASCDPIFAGDPIDPDTQRAAEIVPGAPWVRPGSDGKLGTADDEILVDVIGDVDLVLRTGILGFVGSIPDPTASRGTAPGAVAEPSAMGVPVDFVVTASDGDPALPYGTPIAPPSFEGLPIIVAAFGDLDGDGYIGVTHLDGDRLDAVLEEAELVPIGRRLVLASGGRASGRLFLQAGGPTGAEIAVALTAAAYVGPRDPSFFNGVIPDGPAVMTGLPFLPNLAPDKVIDGTPRSAAPTDLIGIEIAPGLAPDPNDARVGEAFTIPTDGSAPTVDLARAHSGAFSRFGIATYPERALHVRPARRPLRLGIDDAGQPAPYRIPYQLVVQDDGAASRTRVRVVPLDRLGNVADLPAPQFVTISSVGPVSIASPDLDGLPDTETFVVSDARGVEVVLDDTGSRYDGPNDGVVLVEGGGSLYRIAVHLPDPDVDDSGRVDAADLKIVKKSKNLREDKPGFDPNLDLTGDGRVSKEDEAAVEAALGQTVFVP